MDITTLARTLSLAIQHHQRGDLAQAEQLYRQVLQVDPQHVVALHLLGVVAYQVGKHDLAIDFISQALRLKPDYAEAHSNLGNALKALGRLDAAVASYQQGLRLQPDFADAHSNLGNALREQGKLAEAVASYQQAVRLKPQFAVAHNNLGVALKALGKLDEALASYEEAVRLKLDYAEAYNHMGIVLGEQGALDRAKESYQQALQFKPNYAEALNNLGDLLIKQDQLLEAEAALQKALALKPNYAGIHLNLGVVLERQEKLDAAQASYRNALTHKPDSAEAYNNLGVVFYKKGRMAHNLGNTFLEQQQLAEAISCYQRALQFKPDYAEAHNNLGIVFQEQGLFTEAIACYRRALRLDSDNTKILGRLVYQLQHICLWENQRDLSQHLVELVAKVGMPDNAAPTDPFIFCILPTSTSAEQQHRCASQWFSWQLKSAFERSRGLNLVRPFRPKPRITLGYLSADFHDHATTYLIVELLEKHDRERFAILGYSIGPDDNSPTRHRLLEAFDRFTDLKGASSEEAARRIATDDVDILIDLKGYTRDARSEIFALRPAPIQVNYLGYPGTMGAPFMNYIVVDDFVVPPEQQTYYTEKLVHLPGCYQVNDSRRTISPHTPSRAACALPEEGFVFCCFNNSYKITPEMFTVWMELLKAVPKSVLWLLEGNRFAPVNLRREAESRAVAAERLVFAPHLPLPDHLARHCLADLFLDTFPVNAHTTASDALWAGCPVLTLTGETFVSRVAGSLLRVLGLSELITTSFRDYQQMALRLAQDAKLLADLRARLEANRKTSPLFDAGLFARNIERAYATMWEIHAAGETPRAFAVPPEQTSPGG